MAVKKATNRPTESDFESELQKALGRAFPWLPSGSISHQTKFTFKFGHLPITVDGRAAYSATARADVLLSYGQEPLAVLELKRPGNPIDELDIEQGLSYARMLHPRPPLVAVTNGTEISLRETHTGAEWSPSERSETELANLLKSAFKVAEVDLKRAVSTLMGSNSEVWMQAIRHTSSLALEEQSGAWADQRFPFVSEFLIPRKATAAILGLIQEGARLILLEGPPLGGKSNVLRELTVRSEQDPDLTVLFVEADSGAEIFRGIADALSNALSWPVTRDEARNWLVQLSKTTGPRLVIAVDGLGIQRDDIRRDVEDLSSQVFGNGITVVLALDDSVAERLVNNSTGRKLSAIGRRAARIELSGLDDDEFQLAAKILWSHRMGIMKGGEKSPELRITWILRAIASHVVSAKRYADTNLAAALLPLLSLDLIQHTRDQFPNDELRILIHAVAEAVLHDARDKTRPMALVLVSMATYVVRRKTLLKHLTQGEMEQLVQQGYLRPVMDESGEATLVVRSPELLASEAAHIIGKQLAADVGSDPEAAAKKLAGLAESIPLGDIVAAQAVLDAAQHNGGLPLNLIMGLIKLKPQRRVIAVKTRAAMYFPGIGIMEVTFEQDGSIVVHTRGKRFVLEEASNDRPVTYSDMHSWLILSHLAGHAFAVEEDGKPGARVDPIILTEVGTCPIVLRAVSPDPEMIGITTHQTDEGEVVCEKAGMVEPITVSIFKFLSTFGAQMEDWLDDAVERNSFPLLMRIHTALDQMVDSANTSNVAFARRMLDDSINPALSNFPSFH